MEYALSVIDVFCLPVSLLMSIIKTLSLQIGIDFYTNVYFNLFKCAKWQN